jgi:hypothetical protein
MRLLKLFCGDVKMKRIYSAFVVSILAASSLSTLSACDDGVVAGGVAGAVIGAGIGAAVSNNNRYCYSGYDTVCSNYYDYYGNSRRECRQVYNNCRRYSESLSVSTLALAASGNPIHVREHAAQNGLTVEAFAAEYWLSFAKADQFWTALEAADQGDANGLYALGLSGQDIQLNLPTPQGTDALAKSLDQRVDLTTAMMNRIRAWSLGEKIRICAKPKNTMTESEKSLCNVF